MKKFSKLFLFPAILLISHLLAVKTPAQGICVIEEQKVGKIMGNVKYLDTENFIAGAKLKLTDRADQTKVISETMTGEKGWFEFGKVDKGKYVLIISKPNLVSLYVPLKIGNNKKDAKLQISLGALLNEPCGGGDAQTTSR